MKTITKKLLVAAGLIASAALYGAIASAHCNAQGDYPGGACCGEGTASEPEGCAWGFVHSNGQRSVCAAMHPFTPLPPNNTAETVGEGWGNGVRICRAISHGATAWSLPNCGPSVDTIKVSVH